MTYDNDDFHQKALIARLARALSWCIRAIDALEPETHDLTPGYCEARSALTAVTEEHGSGWEDGHRGG